MEFIIDHECFKRAISDVNKAIKLKTPFPILTGIKIVADDNCLILVGSNSDIAIEKVIPLTSDGLDVLEVFETGSVVISAKYLNEIVKKLQGKIHIRVDEKHWVTIRSDEIVTKMYGFNAEQYPNLPQIDEANYIKIPSIDLIEIIKQTEFAVSKSENRPVLTGINLSFEDNQLTCVATNSQRLALRKSVVESNINGSFIVPGHSLNEWTNLINKEQGVTHIFASDSYMVFKSNTTSLYCRLIEGNYPNILGLFPNKSKTTITLNTRKLLEGIDRASLFASEWKNNNVHLEIKDGTKIRISSNSSQIGTIEETQTIKALSGENNLSISLDGTFLIDALKEIKDEEIRLSFGGSMRAVLIEPLDNSSYLHLISPVRSY